MQKYGYTHTKTMRLRGELDTALSPSSKNPVENKTLYDEFADVRESIQEKFDEANALIEKVRAKVELTDE